MGRFNEAADETFLNVSLALLALGGVLTVVSWRKHLHIEPRDAVQDVPANRDGTAHIRETIRTLPSLLENTDSLDCRTRISRGICAEIRALTNMSDRVSCIALYTNEVATLRASIVTQPKCRDDYRGLERAIGNYWNMVELGFSLLIESRPDDVTAWEFLLDAPVLFREIRGATVKLLAEQRSNRDPRIGQRHLRALNHLIDDCRNSIAAVWLPMAERTLPSDQLTVVRTKINATFDPRTDVLTAEKAIGTPHREGRASSRPHLGRRKWEGRSLLRPKPNERGTQ